MSDIFLMDVGHPREYLLHVILDSFDVYWFLLLLVVLNDIFKIFLAILKNNILSSFALF
jgi:hypothetical protein